MRILLVLVFAAALHAAPITFTCAGACSAVPDGWAVSLYDGPGTEFDRIATFTASEPIAALSLYADNLPQGVGSGLRFYLDGALTLDTGLGNLVQQTLTLVALTPFTSVRLETNEQQGWQEHALLLHFNAARPASSVPEPGTWLLMAAGLASIVGWRRT